MNCLAQAITEERIHQVRLLLSMNVDSSAKDKRDYNRTPLIKCCQVSSEEAALKLIKILMKFKININERDNLGRSALHYVSSTGKIKVALLLLNEDGIELNSQDNEGKTPLMLAASAGYYQLSLALLRKLIKFGLDIDVRDNYGFTPLLMSIKNEHYNISHDLIRKGFGNACTTIHDNDHHMNATEWLRSNLEKFRTNNSTKRQKHRTTTGRLQSVMNEKHENSEKFPILKLNDNSDNFTEDGTSVAGSFARPDTGISMKSKTATPSMLFEPDPYSGFGRPSSSGALSKSSSVARFSASSKRKLLKPMEFLEEEEKSLSASQRLDNSRTLNVENHSVLSYGTAKSKMEDLESITELPYIEESLSPLYKQTSDMTKFDTLSPYNVRSISVISRNAPTPYSIRKNEENMKSSKSTTEVYSIHKLKQAINDKHKRKIARASTAVFRPLSSVLSGIPLIQAEATTAKDSDKARYSQMSAQKTAKINRSSARNTSAKNVSQSIISSPALQLLHAESNLSVASLITESEPMSETTIRRKLSFSYKTDKKANHLETLFKLYTDSCLWKPKSVKSTSLSVQPPTEGSEKYAIKSEASGSTIFDLNGSIGQPSEAPTVTSRPKTTRSKSRLISGSATSRTSRGTFGSAGGKSTKE